MPICHTHIFLQRPYALRCLFGREDGAVVGVLYATMHMDSYYNSMALKYSKSMCEAGWWYVALPWPTFFQPCWLSYSCLEGHLCVSCSRRL